jgi:alkylation response protein AidB-like acyl-CoA dehydrogenase
MDFGFTESQEMLRRTARNFLERECPKALVREMETDCRGYSPNLNRMMADLGWFGLIFPEKYGGDEADFMDLLILQEEIGRFLVPGTFFPTVVLGGLPILEIGTEEQKQRFLPRVARGEIKLTLALTEPDSWYNAPTIRAKATSDEDGYVINGVKLFVPYAHVADFVICAAKTKDERIDDGITLFIVDGKSSGITCNVLDTIAVDKQCEVIFSDVRVSRQDVLGELHHGWAYIEKLLEKVTASKCAEMIGGSQRVLEMSVDYAKQRIQFGRPIGSFQIIQSHCVEMLSCLEEAKLLTYEVGWMLSQGLECAKEVSMAKARASECYRFSTAMGIEIHGGVGAASEHDMTLHFRRAKSAELMFGDTDFHEEKIAIELGLSI